MTPLHERVPAAYIGLWRRAGIWRSDGSSDVSSRVWWFQSARFCFDLRIPLTRPAIASAADAAQLDPRRLANWCAQSGFAGSTVVAGERCEWRPELAFPALSGQLDAGSMRFDAPDRLHERGLDGSYDEDWVRLDAGPAIGVRLLAQDGRLAYLILSARTLAWAVGLPGATSQASSNPCGWAEFTLAQADPASQWMVQASTLPWREDQLAFARQAPAWADAQRWMPGESLTLGDAGHWRLIEIDRA